MSRLLGCNSSGRDCFAVAEQIYVIGIDLLFNAASVGGQFLNIQAWPTPWMSS